MRAAPACGYKGSGVKPTPVGSEGAVLSEARKQGFKAKWRYRDGWRLVNHGGKIVAYGPMWRLAKFLGIKEVRR
jgi:hypothetical protein